MNDTIKKEARWKTPVRAICFALVLISLLNASSFVFMPKSNGEKSGMTDQRAKGFLAEPENSLDVVAVGNSDLYSGITPMDLYENYGYTMYVCGQSKQKMAQTYDLLKEVLSCQKPKLVIIETDVIFDKYTKPGDGAILALRKTFPVFEYHGRWKNLKLSDFTTVPHYDELNCSKGYAYLKCNQIKPYNGDPDYMKPTDDAAVVSKSAEKYLDKMLDLLEKNGIPVLFMELPSITSWNMKKHNGMQKLANEKGIPFIDMNLSDVDIDWQTETRDKGNHLNYAGALKTTDFLGKYLKEHYDLPDRRADADYAPLWNESLSEFRQRMEKELA